MFIANITLKEVLEAQKRRYSDEAHLNLCRSQKKRVPLRNTGLWITIPKTASPWFVQMGSQREGSHGDPAPHFGAPHHPVHWKCQVCERGEGGDTTKSKQVNRRRKAAESSRWSYCNYTTTTEPLAEDEQVEEEEQVQIVYPVAPRRFPPRDTAFPRPRRTLHVPHYPALSERDYFGTRATWLSEEGYCDASGHAVAVSVMSLEIVLFLTSGDRQVRDVKLVGFTTTLWTLRRPRLHLLPNRPAIDLYPEHVLYPTTSHRGSLQITTLSS